MLRVGDNILIYEDVGQMVVRSKDPIIMRNLKQIPYVQFQDTGAEVLALLPWNEDSCKLFNNAGVDCTGAAPIWATPMPLVEGKYKPMVHQLFTSAFLTLHPRCYVLSDPRTGKTGALILGMDYLQKQRMLTGGVLIITTVTTIHGVWHSAIKSTLPNSLVEIVHGDKKSEALRRPAEFYITNYDSCRIMLPEFVSALDEGRIGAIVIDEMTHIGNPSSQRHKAIDTLCNGRKYEKMNVAMRTQKKLPQYLVGMTGSPGNNPETVYGMARMINQWKLPCTSKTAWMDLVSYQAGPERFMRKLSPQAPKIIFETLQPALRFRKQDVLKNLPPVTTQDRECPLSPEQKRLREQFKQQALALHQSGVVITAANGGVLATKLLQTALGFIHNNSGDALPLEHKDRTQTILEAIGETDRKVVVFGIFRQSNRTLTEVIQKAGYSVEVVDGDITGAERSRILHKFQCEESPHVLVCHPTTTAFGVELSAADTIIFNGPPILGGFIYSQALERLSSTKQTASKISIIRIMASPEEKYMFKKLDSGQTLGNMIAGLFEDYSRGIL